MLGLCLLPLSCREPGERPGSGPGSGSVSPQPAWVAVLGDRRVPGSVGSAAILAAGFRVFQSPPGDRGQVRGALAGSAPISCAVSGGVCTPPGLRDSPEPIHSSPAERAGRLQESCHDTSFPPPRPG